MNPHQKVEFNTKQPNEYNENKELKAEDKTLEILPKISSKSLI